MELVKELVQKALPSLCTDLMDSLMARLEVIGVNGVDDLTFVKTEDADGILPPIQCRRLIQAFTESRAVVGPASSPQIAPPSQTSPPSPGPLENSPFCEKYAVPWHKMPSNLMLTLTEKKRPNPKERREMVCIVIDDVLSKDHRRPGRGKLRKIAKQIVERYPCSFQDRELSGTKVIGTGYDALFIQLENRVENVRGPLNSSSVKRPAEDELAVKKKSSQLNQYGCVEWQPVVEGAEELEATRDELKNAFKTNSLQESGVRKMMTETYCIQRATINKGISVNTVLYEWPFLFEAFYFFDHASTLPGFPVQTKMAEELSRKGKSIKDFFESKGIKLGEDPVQLISCTAEYFKENPGYFFCQDEDSNPDGRSIPSTPCILIMGDGQFKVAVDQEVVNDHIKSPVVAVSYAFSSFYVLNIKYPKEMSLTLEFIQRVFLGINPERGSKAEMKGTKQLHIPPRLLKFLYELNNFESRWKI